MVLKKRLDYGFNGFHVPVIPKGPRSLRRRDSFKREKEEGQICAFELLAAVAGKLLQECESSSASSKNSEVKHPLVAGNDDIKQELVDDENVLGSDSHPHVSCDESTIVSEHSSQGHHKYIPKEFFHAEGDVVLERTSTLTNYDYSEKVGSNPKLASCKRLHACGKVHTKAEAGSPDFGKSYGGKIVNGIEEHNVQEIGRGLTVSNISSIRDPTGLGIKQPVSVKSESKGESLKCRNPVSNDALRKHMRDGNVGIRDDDENSYRCKQSNTKLRCYRPYRPSQRIGDRRMRKILTSKYWKAAPKLMEYDYHNTDVDKGVKSVYRSRKTYFSRDNFQNDRPFKKRKLFDVDHGSVVTPGGGISSETHSNSPKKDMNENKSDSDDLLCEEKGILSSVRGHRAPYHSRDSHVRLSIKSFRVPELFIELPENATVGYLKRTVMEAVEAMLHGGLDVGVLLQGKKIKDDTRTLFQTGISHNDNLDSLGFTLEPDSPDPSPLASRDPLLLQSCDNPHPLSRLPASKLDSGDSDASYNPSPLANLGNLVNTGLELALSPTDVLKEKIVPESRALVPVPAMNAEALAMVPMSQKNRRSELVQRRTRRPFSVSEVEALVHAVEKLGTGRWRDVKFRSFDNANHRTYVDLKDKWKTLVHTAQIAPQQRRGEPVPQDLLDRVLAAHSYWSHHQAKHQGKP